MFSGLPRSALCDAEAIVAALAQQALPGTTPKKNYRDNINLGRGYVTYHSYKNR